MLNTEDKEEKVLHLDSTHSVIRSDRLINFSHFTVVFVPVFPLPFHY